MQAGYYICPIGFRPTLGRRDGGHACPRTGGERGRDGSTAVLAATEPAIEVVTPEHRSSVLTNQEVRFLIGARFARGSELGRDRVRGAFVGDVVKLDQVLDEGAGIFVGARELCRPAGEGGGRYRKAGALGRHMNVKGNAEACH